MQGPQAVLRQAGCNLLAGVRQAVVDGANPCTEPASLPPAEAEINTLCPGSAAPQRPVTERISEAEETGKQCVYAVGAERSGAETHRRRAAQATKG